jgi:hypothetical protein
MITTGIMIPLFIMTGLLALFIGFLIGFSLADIFWRKD